MGRVRGATNKSWRKPIPFRPANRNSRARLSRGHRASDALWVPRVGHDAAECLWRSVLYRVAATVGLMVFVAIVFAAGRLWYVAYVEAVVPVGCTLWSLVEYHRFQRRAGRAVGVFVGWGHSIPTNEERYLHWCDVNGIKANPFQARA